MVESVLSLQGVGVRRGSAWILRDVDWTVGPADRWVVLGPNGAGKSTLLGVASTRLHPTRGSVRVLGETLGLTDVFDLRPRIGLVGAGVGESIPPREKVRDVVVTASWGITGRWREAYDEADLRRAESLLRLLGVAELAERAFGSLSDGERKRTQIARALMTDPEILLLDEPAAGLDLGGREALVRRLAAMAADATSPTTVLVTHHVEEIPPGTTHALLLRQGAVVAAGPVDDVLQDSPLSQAYGLEIRVDQRDGRWTAVARS
ncbi:MAG: ABC transporter ATP-binding protein [Candidatus Nanopelagicales bacterium]